MIDAAIVGLGRSGKTRVEAVRAKSGSLRFSQAVSCDPRKLFDYAAICETAYWAAGHLD